MRRIARKLITAVRRDESDYIINVDAANPQFVKGWSKRKRRDAPLKLRVMVDGRLIAERVDSNFYREDLATAGIGDGRYGFRFALPADLPDNTDYEFCFFDDANGKLIFRSRMPLRRARASFEGRNGEVLIGWAHGVDSFNVYSGNDLVLRGVTPTIMREDVNSHYGGSAACGFRLDVSKAFLHNNSIVSIRNPADDTVLTSMQLDRIPVVESAKKIPASPAKFTKDQSQKYYLEYKTTWEQFDSAYYLAMNPDVARSGIQPFKHFMDHGWKECRNPSANFDIIWYTLTYLGSDWSKNALHHYATVGSALGYLSKPQCPLSFDPPTVLGPKGRKIRRICLFAGYDAQGLMDATAIELIAELARHADVYYLADCHMAQSELDKIAHFTKGAWAERHERYDFGSWSKLAQELVGWDVIERYDELILSNDSGFLMREFDKVFAKMDERSCDWWGLQATKGVASTFKAQGLKQPISIEEIKAQYLDQFERDPIYDFLIGSYFQVYRKPVINDRGFRSALSGVQAERSKLLIIRKYEIGLTRYLISQGFEFDTFVGTVYPEQAVYTEKSFDLLAGGFPLLKRFHLIQNHYGIEDLWRWPDLVRSAGIEKDLTPYKKTLQRVADAFQLSRSMDVLSPSLRTGVSARELVVADKLTPKYEDWWCFPVCAYSHLFNDNIRALFEEVKNDPSIKKIVLTRSKHVSVDGINVKVLPLNSVEGQFYLLRSRHIFLKHTVHSNLAGADLSGDLHHFHNLWHGIPLKRIGYASLDQQGRLTAVVRQNKLLRSVICASKIDQLAMATAYWPLSINEIWLTGLPRHDLITKDEVLLPREMREQLSHLRETLQGRKLVIFAPTFKNGQHGAYYDFSPAEVAQLTTFLSANGLVMGVREHMADKARQYSSQLKGDAYISIPETSYPMVEILMREAIALVTDYSSIFIDFLITGRPVISFAYDYERYVNEERGLFYDLDWCFPGTIAKNFASLMTALRDSVRGMSAGAMERYAHRRQLFIENLDTGNAARVVDRVKALHSPDTTLLTLKDKTFEPRDPKGILWVYDEVADPRSQAHILNLCAELSRSGWRNKIVKAAELDFDDLTASSTIVLASFAADDAVIDMVEAVRRAGCLVIAQLGDFVFAPALLRETIQYQSSEDRPQLRSLAFGQQRLMEVADIVLVATETMKAAVEHMDLRSVVAPEIFAASARLQSLPAPTADGIVRVGYLPSPHDHFADFGVLTDIPTRVAEQFPNVEFHLFGVAANEGAGLTSKWIRHSAPKLSQRSAVLQRMDIILAPRALAELNEFRSDGPFVEAATAGRAFVASPTPAFKSIVHDGVDGFLARSADEWVEAIVRLASDSALRSRIGLQARNTVSQVRSAASAASAFAELIKR